MDPALPAGAVAVPVPVEEGAAAAAPRPSRTQVITRATVKWVGASGARRARRGARRARRVAWAAALLVMGFAAAGLAIFALTLPAPDSRLLELVRSLLSQLRLPFGIPTAHARQ